VKHRFLQALGFLTALLLMTGCGGGKTDADAVVLRVAEIERSGLDFQRFLRGQLAEATDDPEVKSRLFDLFVEEQLMLEEARRKGIEIADEDIEAYLVDLEGPTDADRSRAYGRLAQLRLQEVWAEELAPVTQTDVDAYLEAEGITTVRRVELRSLMVPDADEAARLHRQIDRRRMTFDEAVALHQHPSMPNTPFRVTWDTLDPILREALEDLKPGRITPPQDLHGNRYLFQFLGWVEEQDDASVLQRQQAEKTLESRRLRDRGQKMMAQLRQTIDHRRYPGRLPFPYREASADNG